MHWKKPLTYCKGSATIVQVKTSACMCRRAGDDSEEGTPVPIPNTVVKLFSPDDTMWATAWENMTSPSHLPITGASRLREWLSGRALPCQGRCRGFESRLPLHYTAVSLVQQYFYAQLRAPTFCYPPHLPYAPYLSYPHNPQVRSFIMINTLILPDTYPVTY